MFIGSSSVGNVMVSTTSGRGHTPEELAERCADRIINVSKDAHPALREQAVAFKLSVVALLTKYFKEAISNDRVTVYNALVDAGHPQLADAIRKL